MTKSLENAIFVSGQIGSEDFSALAEQGVVSVVNHRPDGEEQGQPASAELEKAARAVGIAYRHLPVRGAPGADVVAGTAEAFKALKDGEKMLMFCRSGMRSTAAWALARLSEGADVDTVRQAALSAGYDLSPLFQR